MHTAGATSQGLNLRALTPVQVSRTPASTDPGGVFEGSPRAKLCVCPSRGVSCWLMEPAVEGWFHVVWKTETWCLVSLLSLPVQQPMVLRFILSGGTLIQPSKCEFNKNATDDECLPWVSQADAESFLLGSLCGCFPLPSPLDLGSWGWLAFFPSVFWRRENNSLQGLQTVWALPVAAGG